MVGLAAGADDGEHDAQDAQVRHGVALLHDDRGGVGRGRVGRGELWCGVVWCGAAATKVAPGVGHTWPASGGRRTTTIGVHTNARGPPAHRGRDRH